MYPTTSTAPRPGPAAGPPMSPAALANNSPRKGNGRTDAGAASLLDLYTRDFRRLQAQKYRLSGGVEARVILNLCLYFGEHYAQQSFDAIVSRINPTDEQKNRLFLVFNLVRKNCRRCIGRLASVAPSASATPNQDSPLAYTNADVVSTLVKGLNRKVGERSRMWERYFWMVVGGVAIEHCAYIPNATIESMPVYGEDGGLMWKDLQQPSPQLLPQSLVEQLVQQGRPPESFAPAEDPVPVGDIGSTILSPFQFFIDQSVGLITRLSQGQACYIAEIKTVEWIKANFGDEAAAAVARKSNVQIIRSRLLDRGTTSANLSMRDLLPGIAGSQGADDPPMALCITRYSPPSPDRPRGSQCLFVPDGSILDEQDLRYPEIPAVDFHWEAPTTATSFWSGDFVTDQVAPQKFFNKRMSQLGEASNAMVYELMLLGGDLAATDIPTDFPGIVENGLNEDGEPLVSTVSRSPLPSWFLESIRLITEFMGEVGGTDVFSRKSFPGQLRGPLAVPMMQELIDSEFGPMWEHVGEQLSRVYSLRVANVRNFYPPIRTLHYTGPKKRDEVMIFHTNDILRSGIDYTITIDRSSLVPELAALREARIRERLNSSLAILYVNPRTGMLDGAKIAMDLKYNDEFREDRATAGRKFAQDVIGRLWRGLPAPPVQSFYDHEAMMDEYEVEMTSMEFADASEPIKAAFFGVYEQHRQMLTDQQQAAQTAVESQMMQGAVAQATQQAAAKAAAAATDAALGQVDAQAQLAQGGGGPLDRTTAAAGAGANVGDDGNGDTGGLDLEPVGGTVVRIRRGTRPGTGSRAKPVAGRRVR